MSRHHVTKEGEKNGETLFTPEQLQLLRRGFAPLYLQEAYKNQEKERNWRKEIGGYKMKRQRLPAITGRQKAMLLQVMDRTKWPQGSVDRQKVADKITHQYRVHPENQMYMQNSKRQTREKITSEQKFQLEKALLENPKPLMGSVDREHFRREKCPTVRRDQFEHFLKRN